jgi:uncharacterized protein
MIPDETPDRTEAERLTATRTPTIRALTREECERILQRNHVGRLAYARGNRLDIQPVHFVYADGWLHGRTSPGSKLEMIGRNWWPAALEVDEVEALFSWRSVVVHGGFYTAPIEAAQDDPQWRATLEAVRTLLPASGAPGDPVPGRNVLFRIAAQEMTGRESVAEGTRPDGTG